MWIKAQNGTIYRREAFFMFDVESSVDANIQHHFLRARLTPALANTTATALKSADPGMVVLGEYATADEAQHALERLFPERSELISLEKVE